MTDAPPPSLSGEQIQELRRCLSKCEDGEKTPVEQRREGDDIHLGYAMDDPYGWSFATFNAGDNKITKAEVALYLAMRNALPALLQAAERVAEMEKDRHLLRATVANALGQRDSAWKEMQALQAALATAEAQRNAFADLSEKNIELAKGFCKQRNGLQAALDRSEGERDAARADVRTLIAGIDAYRKADPRGEEALGLLTDTLFSIPIRAYDGLRPFPAPPAAKMPGEDAIRHCIPNTISSRICELGTLSCVVEHGKPTAGGEP